ncbi:DUF5666 domain-containing protein [Muricoccus radiodurans]|uniref:DUF5666 domain-containing protein n=1 Tax=Muricoccus radiodurans TaxID=2231721 RepID=UPI003CF3ABAA
MRRLLSPLLAALLAGCAASVPRPPDTAVPAGLCRIGPDDGPPVPVMAASADRGIGGTGQIAEAEGDRGIGGTGIVGVVTGFASICVNGLHVAYDPDLPVVFADRAAGPEALRAGQVVVLEASGAEGALRARRVAVRHEVSGVVEAVDEGALVVAGQRVVLGTGVRGRTDPRVGEAVEVSGLRAPDGSVIATRIDGRPAAGVTTVYGTLTRRDGAPRIGRLTVRTAPGVPLPPDGAVVATGRVADGVLVVTSVMPDPLSRDPTALFGPGVGRILVEGFAGVGGGLLTLGSGLTVPAPAGVADPVRRGVVEFRRDAARGLVPSGLRDAAGIPRAGFAEGPGAAGPAGAAGRGGAPAPMPDRRLDPQSARGERGERGGAAGRPGPGRSEGRGPGGRPDMPSGPPGPPR